MRTPDKTRKNFVRTEREEGAPHSSGARATPRPQGRIGPPSNRLTLNAKRAARRGSVLIIVIWICFGLVALTLYFANSMSSELRAADNRVDAGTARQALLGGIRYMDHSLSLYGTNGTPPLSTDYKAEALPVGEGYFWVIGRDENQSPTKEPFFGLVDEASKLNLNTATVAMLEGLPGMTATLAASIVAWRSSAPSTTSSGGSDDNTYAQLDPPRLAKHGPFETVDELRLVYGATLDVLFGEDTNRNGALDPNEDDSDQTAPHDNQDGLLNAGILEYVTVYSQQPNTRSNGRPRIYISTPIARGDGLLLLLRQKFGNARTGQIMSAIGPQRLWSVAQFFVASRMTADEFVQIHADITVSPDLVVRGLVNINTASQTVLSCLPGIDLNKAAAIVAYRLGHPDSLTSLAWLRQVIDEPSMIAAGPYITDQTYRFSADIAAVARSGRGYCREKVVFDLSNGSPRILFRQDLTGSGWALGTNVRQTLKAAKQTWQ